MQNGAMETKPWYVSEHLRNITEKENDSEGQRVMFASNAQRPAMTEYWLCWEGHKCHVLSGKRGEEILNGFAAELNEQKYKPRFESGKIYMDLSQMKKLELAQKHSPELPME